MYNKILSPLYILIFEKLLGWKIQGHKPEIKKFVVIVAPHTSNWDFLIGLLASWAIEEHFHWVAKHSMFRWPLAGLFKRWGGIPVNRNASAGFIDELKNYMLSQPRCWVGITPEGTRKRTRGLKPGFYVMGLRMNMPLALTWFDYRTKVISMRDYIYLTGVEADDMAVIRQHFEGVTGRYPDQASPLVLLKSSKQNNAKEEGPLK